jgi:hypothetical protein
MPIRQFLERNSGFDAIDIGAMSAALEAVCKSLQIEHGERSRKTIAVRIIELARRGERSSTALRDRVLKEANGDIRAGEV